MADYIVIKVDEDVDAWDMVDHLSLIRGLSDIKVAQDLGELIGKLEYVLAELREWNDKFVQGRERGGCKCQSI